MSPTSKEPSLAVRSTIVMCLLSTRTLSPDDVSDVCEAVMYSLIMVLGLVLFCSHPLLRMSDSPCTGLPYIFKWREAGDFMSHLPVSKHAVQQGLVPLGVKLLVSLP